MTNKQRQALKRVAVLYVVATIVGAILSALPLSLWESSGSLKLITEWMNGKIMAISVGLTAVLCVTQVALVWMEHSLRGSWKNVRANRVKKWHGRIWAFVNAMTICSFAQTTLLITVCSIHAIRFSEFPASTLIQTFVVAVLVILISSMYVMASDPKRVAFPMRMSRQLTPSFLAILYASVLTISLGVGFLLPEAYVFPAYVIAGGAFHKVMGIRLKRY